MREVKAYVRQERANKVIKALRSKNFKSITITEVEGTGRFTSRKAQPSFNFTVTHNKMAKLELVCKQEDVQNIVEIISKNGSTGEKGDGIIYITRVEEIFKVKTGESSRDEL